MSRIFAHWIIVLSCLLFLPAAYAGSVEITQRLDKNSIVNGATIKVKDPFLQSSYSESSYKVKVALVYGREQRTDIGIAPGDLEVTYTLTYYNENDVQQGSPLTDQELTISLNNAIPVYQSVKVYNGTYSNVKLTVNGTPSNLANMPEDIRLELTLINESQGNVNGTTSFGYRSADSLFYWSFMKGIDSYQLEWVFLDARSNDYALNSTPQFQFDKALNTNYKEPVRINTSNQHHKLNQTFPQGRIYCRIRGVGKFADSPNNSLRYTSWVYLNTTIATSSFEENKNWQYITTYTEDGEYKKVMSYYDGSMRNRQSSTNLSSDNMTLVAETKYDYEGRPSLNMLPVPVGGINLAYKNSFNTFATATKEAYDNASPTGAEYVSDQSGAGRYYSSNNTIETLSRDYIPDAQGYPFTQVEYTRDGTGRISRQSGLGVVFRLMDPANIAAKSTRFFYANTNETELHRLFGTNVGVASHYQKNSVVDPNGQVSVSYLDQEGRTIATALAGNSPGNVQELDYAATANITVSLNGNNTVDHVNKVSRSVSTILNVVPNTEYKFNYNVTGVINNADAFFSSTPCKECTYNLKITILNPDGVEITGSPIEKEIQPSSVTCSEPYSYTDGISETSFNFAEIGKYTVIKELSLNSGAIDALYESLKTQEDYPKLQTFIDKHMELVDEGKCDVTCEERSRTKVLKNNPTWNPRSSQYEEGDYTTQINDSVQYYMSVDCGEDFLADIMNQASENECNSILQQMKMQVSPGGYYYEEDLEGLEDIYDAAVSTWSGTVPSFEDITDPSLFTEAWADDLVKGHREYCHYTYCMLPGVKAGSAFDKKLALVKTTGEATVKGYMPNPIAANKDGYFTQAPGNASATTISNTINNYFDESDPFDLGQGSVDINEDGLFTVLSLADYVACKKVYNISTTPTPEQQWQLFQSLYIGIKTDQMRKDEYNSGACPYYNDENAIVVDRNILPRTQDGLTQFGNDQMMENCSELCTTNAAQWIQQLEAFDNCGKAAGPGITAIVYNEEAEQYEFSAANYNSIYAHFLNYCGSKCGPENPNGFLLKSDIAVNAELQAIQTLLNPLGCALNDIAIENLYSYNCQTITERELTPCAYQVMDAVNKLITGVNKNKVNYNNIGCPAKESWLPGQIVKNSTNHFAFYAVNKECNIGCEQSYAMLLDDRSSATDIKFIWLANDGSYTSANVCPPADQYKNPVGCSPNSAFVLKLKDAASPDYLNKADIVSISAPFIDKSVLTWDNQAADGVAVNVQLMVGGNLVTKKAYVRPSAGLPWITWKDSTSVTNPKVVCSASSLNTCQAEGTGSHTSMGLAFDGVNDVVSMPFTWGLDKNEITIEFWAKVNTADVGNRSLFTIGDEFNNCMTVTMPWADNHIYWDYDRRTVGSEWNLSADYSCYLDKWTHVALVSEGQGGDFSAIYINGKLAASVNVSSTSDVSLSGLTIGKFRSFFFKGNVHDFRIWDKVRTVEEINQFMNVPPPSNSPNLVGYWKMTEGSGGIAYDNSIHGNDGTISGALWKSETSEVGGCGSNCPENPASAVFDLSDDTFYGLGEELQENGDFSAISGGWKFTSGQAISDLSIYTDDEDKKFNLCQIISISSLESEASIIPGKKYQLMIDRKGGGSLNWSNYMNVTSSTNMGGGVQRIVGTTITSNSPMRFFTDAGSCSGNSLLIDNISIRELTPACLNVYENETPILSSCVTTDGKTKSQIITDLLTALNGATSNYLFTQESGTDRIIATGKPGFGSALNGKALSLRDDIYNESVFVRSHILESVFVEGGRNTDECCKDAFTIEPDWNERREQCIALQEEIASVNAYTEWQDAVKQFEREFIEGHFNKCLNSPLAENFSYNYDSKEYHYTLYYYDQAGNLVKTYPPEAVHPLTSSAFDAEGNYDGTSQPAHNENLATTYKYDGLNMHTWQRTPDGGESYFWYNSKGQLRLSQNDKQYAANDYSYTRYDEQGRIIEVGQVEDYTGTRAYLSNPANVKDVYALLDDASFPLSNLTLNQVTSTTYDIGTGENLRSRVAEVKLKSTEIATDATTTYSYDPHGNVKKVIQSISGLTDKTVDYEYDLISGVVNKVYYQKNQTDQFIHAYRYDADKRIKSVQTSANGYTWDEDATYFYYKHGPLARTELGEYKVQGLDYYYTIQGWLKGVNVPDERQLVSGNYKTGTDPGKDGFATGSVNKYVAQDEMAFALGYHRYDYTSIGISGTLGAAPGTLWTSSTIGEGVKQDDYNNLRGLYNGNIATMVTQVHQLGYLRDPDGEAEDNEQFGLMAQAFQYDQLNRIKDARFYGEYTGGAWTTRSAALNASPFDASYTYDKNGNIKTAKVNGRSASLMDDFTYGYNKSGTDLLNNKLTHVADAVSSSGETTDLKSGQTAGNYQYDAIGNLTSDVQEGIESITWSVQGKVLEVIPTSVKYQAGKKKLRFTYDGMGNRVKKEVFAYNDVLVETHYYVRDASGNVMAIHKEAEESNSIEYSIYGSSRVGTYTVTNATGANTAIYSQVLTRKQYELSNHLGNVLTVIADWKVGVDTDSDNKADYYNVIVNSATNYYPFGMAMEDRSKNSDKYRYGFQGQEKDPELLDGAYAFTYRIHDPRIGRFLSIDPLSAKYPYNSPYAFSENRVIDGIELEGLEVELLNKAVDRAYVYATANTKKNKSMYKMGSKNLKPGDPIDCSGLMSAILRDLGISDPNRSVSGGRRKPDGNESGVLNIQDNLVEITDPAKVQPGNFVTFINEEKVGSWKKDKKGNWTGGHAWHIGIVTNIELNQEGKYIVTMVHSGFSTGPIDAKFELGSKTSTFGSQKVQFFSWDEGGPEFGLGNASIVSELIGYHYSEWQDALATNNKAFINYNYDAMNYYNNMLVNGVYEVDELGVLKFFDENDGKTLNDYINSQGNE